MNKGQYSPGGQYSLRHRKINDVIIQDCGKRNTEAIVHPGQQKLVLASYNPGKFSGIIFCYEWRAIYAVEADYPFSPLFCVLDCYTLYNSDEMAEQAPINFRLGYVRLLQDEPLGTGAYGQVCKDMLGELPCAAKLLHPVPLSQ